MTDVTIAGGVLTEPLGADEWGRVNIELAAFDGEVGIGQFPIPDPSGAAIVPSGRQLMVEEGTVLISDGFIIDQDWQRGSLPKSGDQREYSYSVMDANALLDGFRVMRSRPAETDYARVMAFAAIDGPAWDTTWVLNASTVSMPKKTYDGDGGWSELITDLVEFTGKTLFLHDLAGGGRCLHYHLLTNGHACGLAISDVIVDLDATTFAPIGARRQQTSVDLANNVKGRDQAGRTHVSTDATSITAHDADGLRHEALIDFEAVSQADLDVKTAAYLASQKDETNTYACAIGPLTETELALIRVGDLMPVTSAAMGLTASTQRIAHMALSVYNGLPGQWLATLELGAPVRRRARVKPSNPGVVGPANPSLPPYTVVGTDGLADVDGAWYITNYQTKVQPSGTPTQAYLVTDDTFSTGGSLETNFASIISAYRLDSDPTIHTFESDARLFVQHLAPSGAYAGRLKARIVAVARSSPAPAINLDWNLWDGSWTAVPGTRPLGFAPTPGIDPNYSSIGALLASGSLVPADQAATSMPVGGYIDIDVVIPVRDDKLQFVLGFAVTQTQLNGKDNGAGAAHTISRFPVSVDDRISRDELGVFPTGTNAPAVGAPAYGYNIDWLPSVTPKLGQWVLNETPPQAPDGATSAFTTDGSKAYAPTTMRVWVDGNWQNVTEDDPTTGAWSLSWNPATGDQIRMDYMGAG